MINYISKQAELKKQADAILEDLGLIELLKKYGDVTFVGSYALDLIVKKDIDIVIASDMKYKHFLEVANYLFPKEHVYNLYLQDFRKSIYPQRPQGIYCGVSYLIKPKTFWKIDIWFLPKKAHGAKKLVDWVKDGLTDEKRAIILTIKNQMLKTKHGNEVSGMDVYKAVLEENVTTLHGFRKYLKKQGRKL